MDQDQDLAQMQEAEVDEHSSSESEHIDNQGEIQEEVEEVVSEDDSVVEEEPAEKQEPSPRENRRIQKLISNMKAAEAPRYDQPRTMDYRQELDIDNEDVYDRLAQDRESYGKAKYDEGLSRAEFVSFETKLEIDAPKVEAKYPQLDPNSNDFNPAVADNINTWYLNTIGYDAANKRVSNPNLRYSEFVEGIMEMSDMVAGRKVAESSKNIARQSAATGIRPSGTQAIKSQSFSPEDIASMSQAEYEKHRTQIFKGAFGITPGN